MTCGLETSAEWGAGGSVTGRTARCYLIRMFKWVSPGDGYLLATLGYAEPIPLTFVGCLGYWRSSTWVSPVWLNVIL